MENELFWLTLTISITALYWVPYIINRILEHGLWPALQNPQRDARPKADWANRMMYAHDNAVENLIIFAPLVLLLQAKGVSTDLTQLAVMTFFFARVAHFLIYTCGVPFFRTLAFFVGFLCQMTLALTALGIL